jgi:Fe-Mn family superoxide dismutase
MHNKLRSEMDEDIGDRYVLPDLLYGVDALEPHLSARMVELHHDAHHASYVAGANAALVQLRQMRRRGDFRSVSKLESNLAFNVSGHLLHSLLWRNLSPEGGGHPRGDLANAIADTFGDFPSFRGHMTAAAMSTHGSGWALASWESSTSRLVVQQVRRHQDNHIQGTIPLLALDVWEHAYYLQYAHRKHDYFDAVWHVVDWEEVGRRFTAARSADS